MTDDPRLTEARAIPAEDLIARLGITGLHRAGAELVGPCPQCGGTDRFGINLRSNLWLCRRCDAGGDQVALVMHVLGLDFPAALTWLSGPPTGLTDEQKAERARRAAEAREKRAEAERIASRARARTIRSARDIWFEADPAEGTPVRDYLRRRGIRDEFLPEIPASIRYQAQARYTIPSAERRGGWDVIHTGPAMVCAVVDASGRICAVHRTWIDLGQPKGKLVLADPRDPDRTLPAKKVLGSKKGAAVRIATPPGAETMIMAEGVENTLTAMIAGTRPPDCAYWCGVDLGNMSGRMERIPGKRYSGLPDMADGDAWLPPDWVRHLVFVQDGDSDPLMTRARLESGLRRAMLRVRGLRGQIVHAGAGRDLNDIVMGDARG